MAQFGKNQLPLQDMLVDEANSTWSIMEAQGETAYAGDAASVEWQAGDTGDAIAVYNSDVGDMKAPLLNAAGYFIAFLTGVSKTVQDPGPNTYWSCCNSSSCGTPVDHQWDDQTLACDIPTTTTVCAPPTSNPGAGCPATAQGCGSSSSGGGSGGGIPCGSVVYQCNAQGCPQGYACVVGAGGSGQNCCEASTQ